MATDFGPGLAGRLGIDTISGATLTMGIAHFKVHHGEHFFLSDHITIGAGGTALITISVPELFPHLIFSVDSTDLLSVEVFENVLNVSGGTLITPFNNNRNSSKESALTIKVNSDANMGDCLGRFKWGASGLGVHPGIGGQALIGDRKNELILRANTTYAWQMVSSEAGNIVSYKAAWHE